jgi:hypothetical protein
MLSAFLRQVARPYVPLMQEGLESWVGWGSFLIPASILHRDVGGLIAIAVGWGSYHLLHRQREIQWAKLEPDQKLLYERWKRVHRVQKLLKDGHIKRSIPLPVMIRLEGAARNWHDAKEGLHSWLGADASALAEAGATIDNLMMVAVAVAEPVIKQENQRNSDVKRMEQDEDLMSRICAKVELEESRLLAWKQETLSSGGLDQESLRSRLNRAQAERAAAEAELDSLL